MSNLDYTEAQKYNHVIVRAFKRYHRVCTRSIMRSVRTLDQESALKSFISEEYKSVFTQSDYYRHIRHLKFYRERGSDDHFAVWVDIPTHLAQHPFIVALKDFLKSQIDINKVKTAVNLELERERILNESFTETEKIAIELERLRSVVRPISDNLTSESHKTEDENDPLSDNFLNSIHNIKF